MPIGAVSELVVRGTLAYVDFVQDPAWLLTGSHGVPGRPVQVHKTVKYAADSTVVFVARKECWIKLQGRSVDLADVERPLMDAIEEHAKVTTHIIGPAEYTGGPQETNSHRIFRGETAGELSTELIELDLGEDPLPKSMRNRLSSKSTERLVSLD